MAVRLILGYIWNITAAPGHQTHKNKQSCSSWLLSSKTPDTLQQQRSERITQAN